MTYDEWKTTGPDPGLYDDPPDGTDYCPDCGADEGVACKADCPTQAPYFTKWRSCVDALRNATLPSKHRRQR